MASTTASSNLAGAWFGELASAVQGTWQAVAATGEDRDPRPARQLQQQQQKAARGDSNKAVAAAAGRDELGGDVVRCGAAMSDTTLYLLLDRFSPS